MTAGGVLTPSADAALLVGIVLVEALVLYVGYGALEQVVGPTIMDRIASE